MPTVEQHGTGWRVIYYSQGKRRTERFDTAEAARAWVRIKDGDTARGLRYDPAAPKTPIRTYAELWYASRPVGTNHAQSRAKERSFLDQHILPAFGHIEVGALTRTHVQVWVNGLDLAPSTVESMYQLLSQIMRTAAADGYLPAGTPLGRGMVKLPSKPQRRVKALDHDQLEHLIALTLHDFPAQYPIIVTLAETGMRSQEAFGLRREDYNALHGWVDVTSALKRERGKYVPGDRTKTGRTRRVTLTDRTREALDAQLAAHGYSWVFPNRDGNPVDVNTWRTRKWNPLVEAAGFAWLTPHMLRHTHATLLLDAGADPVIVAERLGHTVRSLLNTYAHALPGRQDEALRLLGARARSLR